MSMTVVRMNKARPPKTKLRRTLAEQEQLHELRKLLEQFRREWRERTPPADRFSVDQTGHPRAVPVEVTLARLVLGSAVLFIVVAIQRGSLPRSPVLWAHISVAALFANAAPYLLFAVGEQHVASSTAGMLNATTPLWTVVIALGTRHQRSNHGPAGGRAGDRVRRGGADLLALADSRWAGFHRGDRMPGCGGQLRDQLRLHGPVPGPPWHRPGRLVGLPAGGSVGPACDRPGHNRRPAPRLDATVVASILILGLIGTGAAYVLNYQIIASVGATVASTVTYLLPVVAIILGFLVLGEHVTLLDLAGIALILAGVALTRNRAPRASPRADP